MCRSHLSAIPPSLENALETAVPHLPIEATASCAALTLLAPLVEPAGSHPPLSLRERDELGDLLAERAGFTDLV